MYFNSHIWISCCQPGFLDEVGNDENGVTSGKISSISSWESLEQPKNLTGNFSKVSGFIKATVIFTRGGYILLVCLNRIMEISSPVKSISDAFICTKIPYTWKPHTMTIIPNIYHCCHGFHCYATATLFWRCLYFKAWTVFTSVIFKFEGKAAGYLITFFHWQLFL